MQPSPPETVWPVSRSSTTTEMSAPDFAASAAACLVAGVEAVEPADGASGGASGIGRMLFCGATTVSCGVSESGGVP